MPFPSLDRKGHRASESRIGPCHNIALIYKICVLAMPRETSYESSPHRLVDTAGGRRFAFSFSSKVSEDPSSANRCGTGI